MEERRGAARQRPELELLLYDRVTGECLGRVVNVSAAGIMVAASGPQTPMQEFACRIPIPGGVMLTEELLFDARIVWTRRTDETDGYHIGFELIRVAPEERENIDLVLRELTITGYWG